MVFSIPKKTHGQRQGTGYLVPDFSCGPGLNVSHVLTVKTVQRRLHDHKQDPRSVFNFNLEEGTLSFYPHLCVGFLFLVGHSRACSSRHLLPHNLHITCPQTTCPHTTYSHTTYSHTQLPHTQLPHTQLLHTLLVHTQPFHTQLPDMQLTHTQLTHTHTQPPHTQLVSHTTCSLITSPQTTCPRTTYSQKTFSHTTSSHTHTQLPCVAGVALGDIDMHSAWQAWHLATSTCGLRGRRGTCGTGLALVARLVPSGRRCRRPCLRGRRGTWGY